MHRASNTSTEPRYALVRCPPDVALQPRRLTIAPTASAASACCIAVNSPSSDCFVLSDLLPPGPLVDLVIMDLAFLAPRCHRHAYAFATVGAAGRTVPTFFIGIDHVAQFAVDHSDAGDQRTDIAVNSHPELHHVGVPMAPVGGWRQLREVHSEVQVGGGMAVIEEALSRALRIAILRNIEERHVE